jgi:hypothetical protein
MSPIASMASVSFGPQLLDVLGGHLHRDRRVGEHQLSHRRPLDGSGPDDPAVEEDFPRILGTRFIDERGPSVASQLDGAHGAPHRGTLEVGEQTTVSPHALEEILGLHAVDERELVVGDDVGRLEAFATGTRELKRSSRTNGEEGVERDGSPRNVGRQLEPVEELHQPAARRREALVDGIVVIPDRRCLEITRERAEDFRVVERGERLAVTNPNLLVATGVGGVGLPIVRIERERRRGMSERREHQPSDPRASCGVGDQRPELGERAGELSRGGFADQLVLDRLQPRAEPLQQLDTLERAGELWEAVFVSPRESLPRASPLEA